jgi:hypothetical protein
MGRIKATIGRHAPWLTPVSIQARLLAHAFRNGLWRSLSPGVRRAAHGQRVLTWFTAIPDRRSSAEIVSYLRQSGLLVQEGGNAFYLPPQPGLAQTLGAAVEHYPPGSGFKVLRDFRRLEEAHYLHPERQTRLRRRLIGTPRDQLIVANYLHWLDLGPRVWDVCLLEAGGVSMPAFIVQHVDGTTPNVDEWSAFMARLRTALAQTELRISVPRWERNKDFRCPGCNRNLLRDPSGALHYIDFQNFSLRNPRRLLASMSDAAIAACREDPRKVCYEYPSTDRRLSAFPCPSAQETTEQFRTIRHLLHEEGVEFHNRLVLDIGCGTGAMLHRTLSAGAWWGLGWDRPAMARQARAIAVASGFTRLDVISADLDDPCAFSTSTPVWLRRHLDDSVVLFLAGRRQIGSSPSLATLPWRMLVYQGHAGESLAEANGHVRTFLTSGVRVARGTYVRERDSHEAPLILLARDSAPAAATAHGLGH